MFGFHRVFFFFVFCSLPPHNENKTTNATTTATTRSGKIINECPERKSDRASGRKIRTKVVGGHRDLVIRESPDRYRAGISSTFLLFDRMFTRMEKKIIRHCTRLQRESRRPTSSPAAAAAAAVFASASSRGPDAVCATSVQRGYEK